MYHELQHSVHLFLLHQHQDMLNSLIKKFVNTSIVYGDDNVSTLINEMLPEIEQHMGKTEVYTSCDISPRNDGNPLSIEANKGIKFGGKNHRFDVLRRILSRCHQRAIDSEKINSTRLRHH